MLKLLLDENLSPALVSHLVARDIDVIHVSHRGRQGMPDHQVIEWAYSEDRVLVTANVADFKKLAQRRGLHPGLVFLEDGQMPRQEQFKVVDRVCDELRRRNKITPAVMTSFSVVEEWRSSIRRGI